LALVFNAAEGHSGQKNAKGHTLSHETMIRKMVTYWLSLGFWSSPPRSSSSNGLGAIEIIVNYLCTNTHQILSGL
jgi:hypothetical protein